MAANDQVKHSAQILRQTRQRDRYLVVGAIDYTDLTQTDPKTQIWLNGGNPQLAGKPTPAPKGVFNPGEYVVVQAKNRNGADKTLDSTGSTSGVFILQIYVRDLNTGNGAPKTLTEADRDTTELADDPTLVNGKFSDSYAFKVPDGERWQLYGRWQEDLRTTA